MCDFRAKNDFFQKRGRYASVLYKKKADNRGDVGEKKTFFRQKKLDILP